MCPKNVTLRDLRNQRFCLHKTKFAFLSLLNILLFISFRKIEISTTKTTVKSSTSEPKTNSKHLTVQAKQVMKPNGAALK